MLKKYYIHHPKSIFQSVSLVDDIKHPDLKVKKEALPKPPVNYKCITKVSDYECLYNYNYTKKLLISTMKYLNIRIKNSTSMKKDELIHTLYNIMRLKTSVIKIQKQWDKYFIKKYNECLGPTYRNFERSNNIEDFLTVEDIKDIDYDFYMSFEDSDGFCYTFNIISLYNLRLKNMNDNPYNRKPFSNVFIDLLNRKIKFNNILAKKHTDMMEKHSKVAQIYNNAHRQHNQQRSSNDYTQQIRDIFCTIDNLGNYTQAEWLLQLNSRQLRRFIHELKDIWIYRAQISSEIKRQIYPPGGNPFYDIPSIISLDNPIEYFRSKVYVILHRLIYTTNNDDLRRMSALYILTALTIVSHNAASALPWLFESTQ